MIQRDVAVGRPVALRFDEMLGKLVPKLLCQAQLASWAGKEVARTWGIAVFIAGGGDRRLFFWKSAEYMLVCIAEKTVGKAFVAQEVATWQSNERNLSVEANRAI